MSYRSICTKCGSRCRYAKDSTECRACRGWHDCKGCHQRLENEYFYSRELRGAWRWSATCKTCELERRRAITATKGADRRNMSTKHTSKAGIYWAYRITEAEKPLVRRVLEAYRLYQPSAICRGPKPDHPTPMSILEAAGFGFDLRIIQAVMELRRLERQQREAA